MLRRSDFIAAMYAFSFVFANFGIAIAARMPMMTTTIRSSISVKPFLAERDMCEAPSEGWCTGRAVVVHSDGRHNGNALANWLIHSQRVAAEQLGEALVLRAGPS